MKRSSLPCAPGKSPACGCILAIGPDKGLCGPLTGNLVRKLADSVDDETLYHGGKDAWRAPGRAWPATRLLASFPMGARLPQYSLVFELVRVINEQILAGQATSLDVLYGRFVSYFTQVPTFRACPAPGAVLRRRRHARPRFEPGSAALLAALLPHFLEVRLFDAVVQAFSAEHAARMVAMQNAKSNALEIADTFTLLYNKTRQERITSEILDLANKGKKEMSAPRQRRGDRRRGHPGPGPRVDVEFRDRAPGIHEALEIRTAKGEPLVLETEFVLDNGEVRTLALGPTEGVQRGLRVRRTGAPITVPIGEKTLGRIFDVLGRTIDDGPEAGRRRRATQPHPQASPRRSRSRRPAPRCWKRASRSSTSSPRSPAAARSASSGTHNAYHIGQILYVRKLEGAWNPAKGVH